MDLIRFLRILLVVIFSGSCLVLIAQDSENIEPKDKINKLINLGSSLYESHKYGLAINSFMEALDLAEKENLPSFSCLAYYNLGVIYFQISETGEAIANFRKAYEICKKNDLGPFREVEIMAGIAGVYFEQEEYKKSKDLLRKALKIAEESKDSLMLVEMGINMALISNKTNELDSTDFYLNQAKKYFFDKDEFITRAGEIEAERSKLTGNYENTYLILKNIIDTYPDAVSENALISYLDILRLTKRYDEAIEWEELISPVIGLPYKVNLYNVMSDLYAERGDYKTALDLKDSAVLYKDSIAKINNRRLVEASNVRLDSLRYQMESDNKVLEAESKIRLWIIVSLVFFILLIITIMTTAYIRNKSKHQQQLLNLRLEKEQNEKKIIQEKKEEIEKFALYRQEMLKKDIEQKNRELEAHLMFINSRNDLLVNLINYINKDSSLTGIPAVKNLLQFIYRLQNNNEKDKEEFLLNHEAADPEFSNKLLLKHPDLLQSDIKFLSYIRMNLNSKEISTILNITPDSCKRRKIRVSKKLNLASSSELYGYILKI